MTADNESAGPNPSSGKLTASALAVAYVGLGIGFAYSLATDSTRAFTAVLFATAIVVVLSLAILVTREGLVTAENKLIGAFVFLAVALSIGLSTLATVPFEVQFGVVVLVGVVVPGLLLQYTDYGID